MELYPLKLSYIAKNAIWGGKKLLTEWNKKGNDDSIAETWELSVRDKEMAVIQNGIACGMTLSEYISLCGAECVSSSYTLDDPFPLLVKFIDASDRLSVQVHPDDTYAKEVENDVGKTEMWYIADAEPEASIICGLCDGVTVSDFKKAVMNGQTNEVLKTIPVKKGDSFFIPAGLVHAIGAGVLIAEIQQNSDLTYRVFDYDRVGADGQKRPLHIEKALAVTRTWSEAERDTEAFERGRECADGELLANSKYFSVVKKIISSQSTLTVHKESFVHLLCVDGKGSILSNGTSYPIARGDSYFLPANLGEVALEGDLEVIISRV